MRVFRVFCMRLMNFGRFSSSRVRVSTAGACLLVLAGLLGACSGPLSNKVPTLGGLVTPYQIDIVQGNVVTREQAQLLQSGMSRQQVRDLLGSPLLASVFHANRWDYVFTFKRQGQPPQQRRLTVFFQGEALERFVSDELPSEAEFVASLDVRRQSGAIPALQATDEQLKRFPSKPAEAAPSAQRPSGQNYPPLEVPGESR